MLSGCSSARQLLQRLCVALELPDQPLPRDVASWLREGLQAYRSTDSSRTLCQALGIAKTNGEQRADRDHWIREAARHVTVNDRLSAWARAGRLAVEIPKFERGTWQGLRGRLVDPESMGNPLHCALYRAKLAVAGAALPPSKWTLAKILKVDCRFPE